MNPIRRLVPRLGQRPRLSVSIITKDSEPRLEAVIAQARAYADEVVVGVDADSRDATWQLASRLADTAYRFKHPDQLAAVHMLAPGYCRGDWILRLDDDEFMEPGFAAIVPELLATRIYTHYRLPRKWVVSLDPPRYLHAVPWYPDHALRLFRNDPAIIWKPPRYHSGYWITGPGAVDNRCAILHYEPVWCTPTQREAKIRSYRDRGGNGAAEDLYGDKTGERRPFTPPPARTARPPRRRRVDPELREPPLRPYPAWGCRFDVGDMPTAMQAGARYPVTLQVTNTGAMAWVPHQPPWPILNLAYRLKTRDGSMVQPEGDRLPIARQVRPGESTAVCGTITAPAAPGDYILSWDMVSEFECWFADCGSQPLEIPITVS